jgi:hypothetical protein
MLQTLENDTLLPTKEHPWKASTIKKAKYMLKAHLDETVNKVVKAFWAEAGLANAKIDLPSSYAEAQAKCTNW